MYKISFITFCLISSFIVVCGQNTFREVASNYRSSENYFSSELNKKTIKLYLKEKQPSAELSDVLSNINNLKIVSFKASNQATVSTFVNSINSAFNINEYTPLKIKSSGLNNQFIYLKEDNDYINNLIVINTNSTYITMVEIIGKIDLERIALLKNALNINGLESLSNINNLKQKANKQKTVKPIKKHHKQEYPITDNYFLPYKSAGISIYNRSGSKLIDTAHNPSLFINGYQCSKDYQATLRELNPACIQSINVSKNDDELNKNGNIDVMLKGDMNNVYTVCEGILYFGQNGYLQSIIIDDDCSPSLLHNCDEKPLSEILKMEPEQFKSIELTTDPRNCEGLLDGEYVVIESK